MILYINCLYSLNLKPQVFIDIIWCFIKYTFLNNSSEFDNKWHLEFIPMIYLNFFIILYDQKHKFKL